MSTLVYGEAYRDRFGREVLIVGPAKDPKYAYSRCGNWYSIADGKGYGVPDLVEKVGQALRPDVTL